MPHPPAATWQKVGVRAGARLALLHAPRTWGGGTSSAGVVVRRRSTTPADVVVAFYRSAAALRADAAAICGAVGARGMVWVAWPRKAAGHVSDLSDEVVRATMLPLGVVDVKVAMLDEDWSGLKFVRRSASR